MNWDEWFLSLAKTVSMKSKDPSRRVGAVIASPDNRFISAGFNGYPRGMVDRPFDDKRVKRDKTMHAELNAILFAKCDLTDHTIYVSTIPTCSRCAAAIIQSGISRVVCEVGYAIDPHWAESFNTASEMYREAGVKLDIGDKNELA